MTCSIRMTVRGEPSAQDVDNRRGAPRPRNSPTPAPATASGALVRRFLSVLVPASTPIAPAGAMPDSLRRFAGERTDPSEQLREMTFAGEVRWRCQRTNALTRSESPRGGRPGQAGCRLGERAGRRRPRDRIRLYEPGLGDRGLRRPRRRGAAEPHADCRTHETELRHTWRASP
jgi:hypothetical protein